MLGEEELPAIILAKVEDGLMETVLGILKLEHSIVNVLSKKGESGTKRLNTSKILLL